MKPSILLGILLFAGIVDNAQNPVCQWAKGFGSASLGGGQSVATDAAGSIYAVGNFTGPTLIFGNDTLINSATNGAPNMFVAKFDSSGNELWAKSAGGGANEGTESVNGYGLGTDANGNVYVLGSFETPIVIFGNDTLVTNNDNSFLVKYNAQGNAVWAINMGGTLNNAESIVVDASGNSYITGSFTSGSIIGGNDTIPLAGFIAGFAIKYDSSGNGTWATGMFSNNNVFNDAIAVDAVGNIYVTGFYEGDSVVIANNLTLTNTSNIGMYTVKYSKTGHAEWAENVSVSANISPNAITTDGQGNVYITGNTTSDTLVFGTDTAFTFSTSAINNFFIAGYDSSGNIKWAHCTQNNNDVTSSGIGADAGGNVYVTGSFATSSVTIGNTTLSDDDTVNQTQALFIAEYDVLGNVVWVTGGLTAKDDMDGGSSVELDNKGHLYVSGNYAGPSVIFGNDTLPFTGTPGTQSNVFVTKYDITETNTGITGPLSNMQAITIYPNPSPGQFCFKGIHSGSTVEVYDVLGQRVYSNVADGDNFLLNISTQAKGIYLYRVVDSNAAVQQGKIVLE